MKRVGSRRHAIWLLGIAALTIAGTDTAILVRRISSPAQPALVHIVPATAAGESTPHRQTEPARPQPSVSATASAGTPPVLSSSAPDDDPLPLNLRVDPSCVVHGQSGRVLVTTLPETMIAMGIMWPDGDPRGNWYAGYVGPEGAFTLPFVVTPDVPPGEVQAFAGGTNERVNKANIAEDWFVVAPVGGCPG